MSLLFKTGKCSLFIIFACNFLGCPVIDLDTEFWLFISSSSKTIQLSKLYHEVVINNASIPLIKRLDSDSMFIDGDTGDTVYNETYFNEQMENLSGDLASIITFWKTSLNETIILSIDTTRIVFQKKNGLWIHIGKNYPYVYRSITKKTSLEKTGGSSDDTLFIAPL